MTARASALTAAAPDLAARVRRRARTGGPDGDTAWLEHVLGWTLVVVVAMFVTQVGWL
ncbi:SCO1431 family membrane protein [Streptomyces cirratus]|nr:SCO1431 family membrane protein [Streptomyces cirratus]